MDDIHHRIGLLAAGAAAWAGRSPSRRADLAVRTVHSTLAAANAWVEAAADIKRSRAPAVRAEETATGPLVTLRLLLITARALADIERDGVPRLARPVRAVGREPAWIEVEALPASGPRGPLLDGTVFAGQRATIRCVDPGGVEAFERSWRDEVSRRPLTGGVALVLGAGNVTGLAPGDCVSQIFEYGRAVLLKLHPLHAPLRPVLERALEPLVEAGLLTIVAGGVEVARAALSAPGLDHVHLTGGAAAFDALVWGGRDRRGAPVISQSVSCELGNVTPWFIVPGRYTSAELASQADLAAASIMNNTSFNCIATKLIVTARSWDQREAFLARVQDRLSRSPTRPAWYPGSVAAWETLTGSRAPADGALPWMLHTGVDPDRDPRFVDREWFVPVAAEIPVAADSVERFCAHAHELARRLPGSLAASVTLPATLSAQDAARAGRLVEHLPFGVVAVNAWSALAYSLANVPWGGFPGATLAEPASGIGRVHDPYMLPLVHNTILRNQLASRLKPAWFPWHPYGSLLARGLVDTYGAIAAGRSGLWRLARLLPAILAG